MEAFFGFIMGVERCRSAPLSQYSLYQEKKIAKTTFFIYYKKLRSGEPVYKRRFSTGRPRSIDEERLRQLVLSNPFMTTRELANELGCTFSAVAKRLRAMRFVNKWSVWVPYDLPPQTAERRVEVAKTLLEMKNRRSFLELLVTSNEKWMFSMNRSRR